MMWNGDGSWGWWLLALPLMIMCMVMMGRMMGRHHGSHATDGSGATRQRSGAESILAERLARGEIDIAEYERRLTVLQPTNEADRTHGGVRHIG